MLKEKEKKVQTEIKMMERRDRREDFLARMKREKLDLVRNYIISAA